MTSRIARTAERPLSGTRARCAACGGAVAVYRAGATRPACLSCLVCGRVRFDWLSESN